MSLIPHSLPDPLAVPPHRDRNDTLGSPHHPAVHPLRQTPTSAPLVVSIRAMMSVAGGKPEFGLSEPRTLAWGGEGGGQAPSCEPVLPGPFRHRPHDKARTEQAPETPCSPRAEHASQPRVTPLHTGWLAPCRRKGRGGMQQYEYNELAERFLCNCPSRLVTESASTHLVFRAAWVWTVCGLGR